MKSTLLLNASYEPLRIISAKDAMRLIFKDKAVVLDESPHTFDTNTKSYKVPYVIILKYQVKLGSRAREVRFSRRGVLVRDNYTCVYCGKYGDTIDHVVPRALGGLTTYENCVAACKLCNNKKSDTTLEKLGWELPVVPKAPNRYQHLLNRVKNTEAGYSSWEQYISYYLPATA